MTDVRLRDNPGDIKEKRSEAKSIVEENKCWACDGKKTDKNDPSKLCSLCAGRGYVYIISCC